MRRRTFLSATTGLALPLILPRGLAAESTVIKVRDLYTRERGFSDLAQSLDGTRVSVTGFMAPLLKAESHFFVLTGRPMAVCPFCETDADWIDDILPVETKRIVDPVYYTVAIEARGILTLGKFENAETGFVGQMRLTDAGSSR